MKTIYQLLEADYSRCSKCYGHNEDPCKTCEQTSIFILHLQDKIKCLSAIVAQNQLDREEM